MSIPAAMQSKTPKTAAVVVSSASKELAMPIPMATPAGAVKQKTRTNVTIEKEESLAVEMADPGTIEKNAKSKKD